jgi:hypothetical protein
MSYTYFIRNKNNKKHACTCACTHTHRAMYA